MKEFKSENQSNEIRPRPFSQTLNSIFWILTISVTTCSNQANGKSGTHEIVSKSLLPSFQNTDSYRTDSLITGKTELAKIYSQAIAEYIGAVYKKDKTNFDTLFFGKQFDFPDIDLPTTINGTRIIILTQGEIDSKMSIYDKSSPYINLIGFVENEKAEFIFVTFYPGFNHQYDCYVNFRYNSEKKEFHLDKLRIEVLIRNKEGKAEHFAVYEDGKYVGVKAIDGNKK